jgi:hypothetical protein
MRTTLAVMAAAMCLTLAAAGSAAAAPTWAPAATAPVHPGVQTVTEGAQCTSNFVFFDAAGTVYLGQAAHCAGTGGNTETNGCSAATLPVGTPVTVDGAGQPGTLAYSSWATMQADGETDPDACAYNDISLIRLAAADAARTNPSVPFWGGPTGIADTTATGEQVLTYGNSSLRAGITALSPKEGVSLGASGGGWTHEVYTVTPGIPGDSGSGFMDASGRAFGVLSTLELAPTPAANGVSDLSRMLAYMRAHGGPDVELADGTEAFTGPLL